MLEQEERIQFDFSPSNVGDEETLCRLIFFPDHVGHNGELLTEAIDRKDLDERGFSVYRQGLANDDLVQLRRIQYTISGWIERKEGRTLAGAAELVTRAVRGVKNRNGGQAFMVLDAGDAHDNRAHTEIYFAEKYARSEQRQLRNKLLQVLGEVRDVCEMLDVPDMEQD